MLTADCWEFLFFEDKFELCALIVVNFCYFCWNSHKRFRFCDMCTFTKPLTLERLGSEFEPINSIVFSMPRFLCTSNGFIDERGFDRKQNSIYYFFTCLVCSMSIPKKIWTIVLYQNSKHKTFKVSVVENLGVWNMKLMYWEIETQLLRNRDLFTEKEGLRCWDRDPGTGK